MTPAMMLVGLTLIGLATGRDAPSGGTQAKEATMTARGTFDVKMIPQPADDAAGGAFSRLFLDKTFQGGLEGTSKGQMLASGEPASGSGGYVALERVTGTLNGKRGSFVLQHRGTMSQGDYHMDVTVVPDSGTDELTGIAGAMTIVIKDGTHRYELRYALGKS